MIEIDGSFGEGGGQMLRTSLAFSILTGKVFRMHSIRAGRKEPGLRPQHKRCIEACAEFCGAGVSGAFQGSMEVSFRPGSASRRKMDIRIGTAGSATLLLQSLLLPAVFSGKKISFTITGGTDVAWSMPFDYMSNVVLHYYRKYAEISFRLLKRGYYPKGNGVVELTVAPRKGLESAGGIYFGERASLAAVRGISHASSDLMGKRLAERQAHSARSFLALNGICGEISSCYSISDSTGSGIVLWALFSGKAQAYVFGADMLGRKGFSPEKIGETAAAELAGLISSGQCVDVHLADNLVPLIAVFGGRVRMPELTGHTLSSIYVAEKFLGNLASIYVDREKKAVENSSRRALQALCRS